MAISIYDPQNLHATFLAAIGDEALTAISAIVVHGHLIAPDLSQDSYGTTVGGEASRIGLVRWCRTEADLLRLQGRFPNVSIDFVKNEGASGKHVEVSAGNFRVLILHDTDPDAIIPRSNYARTKAESNQAVLFPTEKAEQEEFFYASMFHSRSETRGGIPQKLQVRFPVGDGEFAADSLDLYGRFVTLTDPIAVKSSVHLLLSPPVLAEEIVKDVLPPLPVKEQSKVTGERA